MPPYLEKLPIRLGADGTTCLVLRPDLIPFPVSLAQRTSPPHFTEVAHHRCSRPSQITAAANHHGHSRNTNRSNGGEVKWGNSHQLDQILKRHPGGFDLFLHIREEGNCKFLLAFVSRAKVMDAMVISEANEDMSLGSWFIGLEVEHIGDRNMCCGTPPEKNSHLTIPGFSSEERKNHQNHIAVDTYRLWKN
ncbi:hypothetical protein HYC85_030449 [Camellia sinensis]|uniref:Uncharacterized protein n=1 Tax=Camellia sinensis TaxID=4442 RepID=A0A7J7G3U4_CAMSI|nr:hypothetical protein HYC85_030449 [Camellia sinensis]